MLHTLVFFTCIFLSKDIGSWHTLVSERRNWENWGGSLWSLWSERRSFPLSQQYIHLPAYQLNNEHAFKLQVHTYRIKRGLVALVGLQCLYVYKCVHARALTALTCRPLHQFCHRRRRTAWHTVSASKFKRCFPHRLITPRSNHILHAPQWADS